MAAPDRKKVLADLQKAQTKGQYAKVAELLRVLIEIDPDDFKLHNTLGDTLVKVNKLDEAVAEYKTAAAKFAADGFVAQAMAIYQKSLKLREDADVRLGMADIQARQGLVAEAKRNYLQVAEKFMQEKVTRKAVDVMQKIADLDLGNVDLRIKLARICEQEGLNSKAVEEYRKAGKSLLERKETAKALSCFQKVIDALPDDVESKLDYQRALYLSGKFREAREGFAALRKLDPRNTDFLLWEGKAAYRLEDFAGAEEIFRKILEIAPDKVDTHKYLVRVYRKTRKADKAAETVRILVDQMVTEKNFEAAVALIRETLEDFPGNSRMLATLVTVAKLAGDRAVQKSSLEKLLAAAETEGDRRMAAGALNDLCVLDPENLDYQQRLRKYRGEEPPVVPTHEEVGLVEEMEELELLGEEIAEQALDDGPEEEPGETMVIERTIDAQAAPGARTPGAVVAPKKPELTREQQEQIREAHTEVDVYLKYGLRESAVEALDKILSLNPADEKALEASIGLTLGIGRRDDALRHTVSLGLLRLSRGQTDLAARGLEEGKRIRKDDPGLVLLEARIKSIQGGGAPATPVEEAAPETAPSHGTAFDIDLGDGILDQPEVPIMVEEAGGGGPDLEEADFYFRQGLFSDALPIYREYHRNHPENVQVLERIEEIERMQGKAPVVPAPQAPPAAPPTMPEEIPEEAGVEITEEEAADEQAIEELIAEAEEATAGGEGIEEIEEAPEEWPAGEVVVSVTEEESVPEGLSAEEMLPDLPQAAAAPAAPVAAPGGGVTSAEKEGQGEEFFDLAAELDEEISQLEEAKGADLDEAPVEDLESVFREFQEGVQAAIGDQDVDTHYNLGIAYKEMGLFSEAIAEFGIAMRSVERSWDAAVMMGICYRERGDFDQAIEAFTKALLISDRTDDEYVGLRYELAQVYEKAGKYGDAVGLYREIQSRSKGFADVAERIVRLASHEDFRPSAVLQGRDSEPSPVIRRSSQAEEPVIAAPSPAQAEPMKEEAAKPKRNRVSYL